MSKAKTTAGKTKATKGDSSKPLPSSQNQSKQPTPRELRKKVELPKLTPDVAEAVASEVVRDMYVESIRYYLDRKEGKVGEGTADEGELKNIEELLNSFEKVIIWFDQDDEWLKELHGDKAA
jgi:hypothetical protein